MKKQTSQPTFDIPKRYLNHDQPESVHLEKYLVKKERK